MPSGREEKSTWGHGETDFGEVNTVLRDTDVDDEVIYAIFFIAARLGRSSTHSGALASQNDRQWKKLLDALTRHDAEQTDSRNVPSRLQQFESWVQTMLESSKHPRTVKRVGIKREPSAEIALINKGLRVAGSPERLIEWMQTPIPSLKGRTPYSLMATEEGRKQVEAALGRIEHGVY